MASPTRGFAGLKGKKSLSAAAEHPLGPEVAVAQIAPARQGPEGCWLMGWRIHNNGSRRLKLLRIHVPHGKFRGEARKLSPAIHLAPGDAARIECRVRCHEPPKTRIENAFLILRVLWRGKAWRIFVRLQVNVNRQGEPETTARSITTQEVGFSSEA